MLLHRFLKIVVLPILKLVELLLQHLQHFLLDLKFDSLLQLRMD